MKSDLGSSIDTGRLVIRGAAKPPHPTVVAAATADEAAALAPGIIGAVAFFLVLFVLVAAYWRCSRQLQHRQRHRLRRRVEAEADAGDDGGGGGCNITVNPLMMEEGAAFNGSPAATAAASAELQLTCLAESSCDCDSDSDSCSSCCSDDDDEDDDDVRRGRRELLAGGGRLAQLASSEDELEELQGDGDDSSFGEESVPGQESARLIAADK